MTNTDLTQALLDHDLVARARAGEVVALNLLISAVRTAVHRHTRPRLCTYSGGAEVAEDVNKVADAQRLYAARRSRSWKSSPTRPNRPWGLSSRRWSSLMWTPPSRCSTGSPPGQHASSGSAPRVSAPTRSAPSSDSPRTRSGSPSTAPSPESAEWWPTQLTPASASPTAGST